MLPTFFANHGNALGIRIMCRAELEVVPGAVQIPAMKVVKLHKQRDGTWRLGDDLVGGRNKGLVMLMLQFPLKRNARMHGWSI